MRNIATHFVGSTSHTPPYTTQVQAMTHKFRLQSLIEIGRRILLCGLISGRRPTSARCAKVQEAKGIQAVLKYDGRQCISDESGLRGQRLHVLSSIKWEYISSWCLLVLSNQTLSMIQHLSPIPIRHPSSSHLPSTIPSVSLYEEWLTDFGPCTIDQSASAWCLGSAQWLMWPLRILFATQRLRLITLPRGRGQRAESGRILVLDTSRKDKHPDRQIIPCQRKWQVRRATLLPCLLCKTLYTDYCIPVVVCTCCWSILLNHFNNLLLTGNLAVLQYDQYCFLRKDAKRLPSSLQDP